MKYKIWIYWKGRWTKARWWMLAIRRTKLWITKWKIVDTSKYQLVNRDELGKWFSMSDKEYKKSQKIYKEKGSISYEFYPCGGIGWGLKIHCKDGEIIDRFDEFINPGRKIPKRIRL